MSSTIGKPYENKVGSTVYLIFIRFPFSTAQIRVSDSLDLPYENKVGSTVHLIFIRFAYSSGHIRVSDFSDENKLCLLWVCL